MREQFSFNYQVIMCFVTLFFRSCLLPKTKANDVRSFAGTVNLFFDEHIMDVIVNKTNTKITNTFSCLRSKPSFVESDKYTSVRETDHIEVNAFFGLMYVRGLLGWNLHKTDHLFGDHEGRFAVWAIMPNNRSTFLLSHI